MAFWSKQIKFDGRQVTIFREQATRNLGITALANVLSIRGELPAAPNKIATYTEQELTTLVATRLGGVQGISIDDAKMKLAHLVRPLELEVNFRRIESFVSFEESRIFFELGIPLYHGWKVVPELRVPALVTTTQLEDLAPNYTLTPTERAFVGNCYEETMCTSYGYRALGKDLVHVKGAVCVFYWNRKFYTVHRKDNKLVVLDNDGWWEQLLHERVNLIRAPSLGRRQFMISCGGIRADDFDIVVRGFRDHDNLMPHLDIQLDHYASLDLVLQCVRSGDYFDMIFIDYDNFIGSQDARIRVMNWRAELIKAGFVGLIIAFIWYWSEGGLFELWAESEVYSQIGIGSIRYVRGDCLEEREDFSRELVPLVTEAVWRREVVYPVDFPSDIESYEYIRRELM